MKRGILTALQEILSAICLILIVLSILANIVARFLFDSPFIWSIELTTILVIWSVYLAFGLGYRDNAHLSISVLADRLPARPRRLLAMATDVLLVAVLAVMLVNCITAMRLNYGMTTMALDLSVSLAYYLAVAVGTVSSLCYIAGRYGRKSGAGASQ